MDGCTIPPFPPAVRDSKREDGLMRCRMKGKLLVPFVLCVGFLTICGPVLAHHGNAAYADGISVFKQATVTKFGWANPHALIDFDVKDAKGNVVHWVCETAAPQA